MVEQQYPEKLWGWQVRVVGVFEFRAWFRYGFRVVVRFWSSIAARPLDNLVGLGCEGGIIMVATACVISEAGETVYNAVYARALISW